MRESLGAMAMSPLEAFGIASNIDTHVRPPFVVFHQPLVAKHVADPGLETLVSARRRHGKSIS